MEIGVGVATGAVIAGGFGGAGRMGYSVNGDVVQLAGRIQALSHQYGPALIVADETQAAGASAALPFWKWIHRRRTAGSAAALYAIMGNPVVRASPKFRALTVFHDHIFQAIARSSNGAWRAT